MADAAYYPLMGLNEKKKSKISKHKLLGILIECLK